METRVGVRGEVLPLTSLDHLSVFDDHDVVAPLEGGQMVGYDKDRSLPDQSVHRALDCRLGAAVEPRGGLVEDDETGVLEKDARERKHLCLAGGEPTPIWLKCRVEAVRQRFVPSRQAHLIEHGDQTGVGNASIKEGKIVPHSSVEEPYVLCDEADPCCGGRRAGSLGCRALQVTPGPRRGRTGERGALLP